MMETVTFYARSGHWTTRVDRWHPRLAVLALKPFDGFGARLGGTEDCFYGFRFESWSSAPKIPSPRIAGMSGMHFLGGQAMLHDELLEEPDLHDIAMELATKKFNFEVVCLHPWAHGCAQPLLPEDVIVDEKGDVTMRGKDKRFVDHRAAMQAARDADRAEREAIEGDAAEADAVDEAEGSRRAAATQRDEEEEAWWRGQVEGR